MIHAIGLLHGTDALKLNEADITESHKRGFTALADQRKVLMAPRTPPAPAVPVWDSIRSSLVVRH
jgi:hypothetical protein